MNRKISIGIFLCGLWIAWGSGVWAQDEPAPLAYDSTAVTARYPSLDVVESYLNHPDYIYTSRAPREASWWDQFLSWVRGLFGDADFGNGWSVAVNIIQYAMLAGILIFAVYQLFNMDLRNFLRGAAASVELPFSEAAGVEPEIDFRMRAEEAFEKGVYRDGIRFYYLHILRLLDASRAIEWHARKTNRDYLAECRNDRLKPYFGRLTYLFDYAWYGNFPVREGLVEEVRSLSEKIAATLSVDE